jgi:hypothetical protein
MAFGQDQGGGLLDPPIVQGEGYADWASMSGMHPQNSLVGGNAGSPGYGTGQRQVALASPGQNNAATLASGSPARANWSEVFNLKGNPIGWVLIASILYLGLMHIHVKADASGGFGIGKGK